MFMRLLQLDDLMTSYTNTCPEAGLFVRLPRSSRLRLRCRGRTASPYIAGPRREPPRALDGMATTRGLGQTSLKWGPGAGY